MEENLFIDDFNETEKVESEVYHNFVINPLVIGILKEIKNTNLGRNLVFIVSPKKEITIGDYTALRDKITNEDIGKKIKIVYIGEQKSNTGRVYMNFGVYKKNK
jgi:hypothetical protein